jgi:hypothetical protein
VSLTVNRPAEATIDEITAPRGIEVFVTEVDSIARAKSPATVSSLAGDVARVGVMQDMVLLVHSSLSALGWVAGHAPAVVLALEVALGPRGTLVMPTHSTNLSDPAQWQNPPVPESWWETIRAETPAYDPDLTPTREMGAIAHRRTRAVLPPTRTARLDPVKLIVEAIENIAAAEASDEVAALQDQRELYASGEIVDILMSGINGEES